ncbi:CcoQ/FixQ family Cbb3-type cytochrome c oxidase assembly chaperone [Antarcticibacterium flavum]|uniref:CcoQ/FixQ family Cbb3-type cytochrome c oxidase assembly chaperone n=1 Tax=Antarcticibacterium flavum TaxID=2058175 RepID=A0A5B7X4S7_9FLAO|nr:MULTISPECIES: CcoQ/FixQ family Cbb3-type cytochrome c oxidase assembly chaperone [Antarcticibacterium]MCM4158319.1 CcoQ/FixQ family Cbb3-type cytochrome c oxidase assembly chaperone [Antarcticibacterium sp. W02-3]QCY70085.1 CcoQ/FixQ family Cbb3-type cytochrome c oxidase assembly chaperone [Antarcticibacterium flavum]
MFKFVKGHMETIAGVEIFPIISLLIFFLFFVGLFWWVFTAKKDYIKNMEEIPLESEKDQLL